jgi:hypothetical protein
MHVFTVAQAIIQGMERLRRPALLTGIFIDHIHSVRAEHWLYIRNYLSSRPMLKPNRYRDEINALKPYSPPKQPDN